MSFRQTAAALVVAAAAVPAFAQTGTWYPGELGFVPDAPRSQFTRDQVKQNLADFVRQGGRLAAGELEAIAPKESFAASAATVMGASPAVQQQSEPFVNGGPN
jgi:hypothetical protein